MRMALTIVALFSLVPLAQSQDPKIKLSEDLAKANMQVMDYLKKINGQNRVRITPLDDDGLKATFPKHNFVAVLYPQFPLGVQPPQPLKEANVLVVTKSEGKVMPLSDLDAAKKFFLENVTAAKEKEMELTTAAWLRFAQELSTDGFYRFGIPGNFTVSDGKSKGIVKVDPVGGNKGDISAVLSFDGKGKLTAADTKLNLVPGPRPICQARKLLDPDPVVRRMAEDAIRVMGRESHYYLMEERAKATPDLQKAIDRIWQRILDEGR